MAQANRRLEHALHGLHVATGGEWGPRAARIALLTIDRRDFPGKEEQAARHLHIVRNPAAPTAEVAQAIDGLLHLANP